MAASNTTPIDTVAFILIRQDAVLVEKRRQDKPIDPGKVAIPGGKVEPGESRQQAVARELKEELGLEAGDMRYVCSLLYRAEGMLRIHYYWVLQWTGCLVNNEAAALFWLPLSQSTGLDCAVDRRALDLVQKMASDLEESEAED